MASPFDIDSVIVYYHFLHFYPLLSAADVLERPGAPHRQRLSDLKYKCTDVAIKNWSNRIDIALQIQKFLLFFERLDIIKQVKTSSSSNDKLNNDSWLLNFVLHLSRDIESYYIPL